MGRNFLFSKKFRPPVCLIQPPIQRVSERKWRRYELTFPLSAVKRLINEWSLVSTPSSVFMFFAYWNRVTILTSLAQRLREGVTQLDVSTVTRLCVPYCFANRLQSLRNEISFNSCPVIAQ